MYAVFRTGGKQYRARQGERVRVEKVEAEVGATIEFDQVLMVGEGADVKVGKPLVSGGKVSGKVGPSHDNLCPRRVVLEDMLENIQRLGRGIEHRTVGVDPLDM